MFKNSSLAVRLVGNLIIVSLICISILYGTSLFYQGDRSDFLKLNKPPVFLNSETLAETNVFRKGMGIVSQLDITKYEVGCFAEYAYNFTGPVSFQITSGKSRFIDKRGSISHYAIKNYLQIPLHIPDGEYQVQMSVYPTCDGQERDPFTVFSPVPIIIVTD